MTKIDIYTSTACPYCMNAKKLLDKKQQPYNEIKIDQVEGAFETMLEKSGGRRSVPQIFINDIHIGGFDDLSALAVGGELDDMLAENHLKT